MHQPVQLQLFEFSTQPQIKAIHDPYWDELSERSDIIDDAFLTINAENEVFDIGAEIAPEQEQFVRAQISFKEDEPTNTVRAQVNSDTAPSHNYPELSVNLDTSKPYTHWVEKYWVKRRGEKHEYYRYCWMEGRKKYRCHISAKSSSISANHRKKIVEEAISDGQSPQEIKQLIRIFNNSEIIHRLSWELGLSPFSPSPPKL